ncbi:MAG: crotonase/enoyl-CoA hydratase family protein [Pseudomonadales bacterium]|jgi:enoyl-CoA hydratase|nr:crotonase/enoyl-CoA hydratase family protein [Pseudomonadales bacterium]MDP7597158.1 crotonase/enoyl-CoA hydratase family protein [Pseudomonadales bacterium]HJN48991.1 crotonase/enoyl-CoA hydratase family protein [Pseudomonadales bacterium]|tara:strand:- start:1050 stop:2180 length:1131 start_codon:yes stop_codon:yes gene_type:complete
MEIRNYQIEIRNYQMEQIVEEFKNILYEVENGRARITLNRPEKLNALSHDLLFELQEALWEADDNRAVHCVIIKGQGRAFSAGYDLSGPRPREGFSRVRSAENSYRGGSMVDDDAWQMEKTQRYRMTIFDMHKPTIAQVHGYCLAGGTDVALLCDMVIVADDATIGFPPARDLGALPNNMWLYNIGPQWAKRLMLTGDSITGAEAQQLGWALKAVPGDMLENEVEHLADRLALIDPDLLSANKRIINQGLELMGARTLQRMAVENDVRGHNAAAAKTWGQRVSDQGLRATLRERDGKFGDGRARVNGPEIRDAAGRLVDKVVARKKPAAKKAAKKKAAKRTAVARKKPAAKAGKKKAVTRKAVARKRPAAKKRRPR